MPTLTPAEAQAQGWGKDSKKKPATPRNPHRRHKDTTKPPPAPQREEKQPAERHVTLPPPPDNPGPWRCGSFRVDRATNYPDRARVVLTGPTEDFEQLLAYLQAYQKP